MKIALLSDIHANRPALAACLAHARGQGAEQFALLGDLVGYGGEPAAVLDDIMALADRGAWVVLGNHDAMALSPPAVANNRGALGAQWTHDQLRPEHVAFLQSLPLTARLGDTALLPGLLDGLQSHVPDLELHRIEGATHWIVHEQPELVAEMIGRFLARPL